ncbi:cupin domain-containing protein [Marinivivus vitaminiproducens]|uniref:cupin domain-containing protein n=1 Tax=Marinivivus vitaminiproducens TaxID=3035935 RepID=UPI0027A51823|nr:cupin domain-containing protein [Geminicoccaceae bacterium SCSIO 64248]
MTRMSGPANVPARMRAPVIATAMTSILHEATRPVVDPIQDVDWLPVIPGEMIAIRLDSAHTAKAFALVESVVEPMAGPPLHVHHDADEMFYVLSGHVTFARHDEMFEAGPGDVVYIPRDVPHAFRNFGDEQARMLVTFTPGGFEDFFRAAGAHPPERLPELLAQRKASIVGPQIPHPRETRR